MSASIVRILWKNWLGLDSAYRALILAAAGIGLSFCSATFLPPAAEIPGIQVVFRIAIPCISVIVAGWAVAKAPKSVVVVGATALCAALAVAEVNPAWDTLRLLLLVASTVAACTALILLLPVELRRLAVSLLILFHFCGIFCAVLAAPPPGSSPPWLTSQLWTRVFRPYLQFVYLNNAYHFYSPEPGPATLLWFRIERNDGTSQWEKIPNRRLHANDPLLIEYYRRLSLTENAAQLAPVSSIPPEIARRRAVASLIGKIPSQDEIALEAPAVLQFRPLSAGGKRFIASYVRHIGNQCALDDQEIKEIKVYRIVHTIIHPGQLASGTSPGDHTLYAPFYQGTFDATGKLLNPDDPYLYWYIPVLSPKSESNRLFDGTDLFHSTRSKEIDRDYLKMHAGSSPWEDDQ